MNFERYIGLKYDFGAGPKDQSPNCNCQKLIHQIYRDCGYPLPENFLSKEIFEDNETFVNVGKKDGRKVLDIYIFGKKGETDYKKLHLAIFTGLYGENNDPILIHASGKARKVIYTTLSEFIEYKNGCEELKAIKRLKVIRNIQSFV